jgi:hypothetical protein
MGISIIPAPAGGATESAFAATLPDVARTYEHIQGFTPGVYSVSVSPTSTNCQVVFVSATATVATVTTTSGVAAIQLSSAATKCYITTVTGGSANAIVTIAKTAAILTPDDIGNGTLDTINATGTYNQTGLLSVLAFGGGSAGGAGGIGYGGGGAGGAIGGIGLGVVYNNAPVTVTVGAGGVAATSNNTNIVAPNQSSFGNLLTSATSGLFYNTGVVNNGDGQASRTFVSFNGNSTTGGGGSGGYVTGNGNFTGGSRVGGGSGIGTGGSVGSGGGNGANLNPTTRGTAGTGKASGGGAGNSTGNNNPNAAGRFGGDGAPGVVYVLRGW